MSLLLNTKQKDELHKSLLGYFNAFGNEELLAAFKKEAKIEPDPKFKDMLERKYRSILRLEKRIDELVAQERDIKHELENFGKEGKVVESEVLPDPDRKHKAQIDGHRGPVLCLCFHPRFNILVTTSEDNSVKVWDADSGNYERTLVGHTDTVEWCAFNASGTTLATSSKDMTIRLWDFGSENDGTFQTVKTLLGHDHTVSCVTFTKDGDTLYSASRDKTIKQWEVQSGHCKKTYESHTDWVRVVEVSPDQTMLASCGLDQTVCVWDIKTGNCITTLRDHDHVVESVCWSNLKADNNIINNLLDDEDAKLARAYVKKEEEKGTKLVGGMFLLSASRDRTIRLWMVFDGVCVKTIRGHDSWVRGVMFHPSGRYAISCSDDKTIRVWDFVKYGRCKSKFDAHESFISCVAWNMHSPMMATGCVDNSVRIWDTS